MACIYTKYPALPFRNYLYFCGKFTPCPGFSGKNFGARYSYNRYLIDLRKYFTLAENIPWPYKLTCSYRLRCDGGSCQDFI